MTGTAATMGIEENLALAKRRGKPRTLLPGIRKAEREEYRELLKILDLGLEDRLTSKVGLLSGGQRQALTLLMATLQKPKLLLLDEHTAALDPKTAAKVLDTTEKIVEREHLTTLMITHNMKDAIEHGNRLIMMMEGKIILDIKKVLDTTEKIVEREHLTTLMITHNMKDAIEHGNRLIMMMEGKIILDIKGEEKKRLTVEDLLHKFEEASGGNSLSDKAILG